MKKRTRKKEVKNIEHRGNNEELTRNFELRMKIVRKVPKSYYSEEGGVLKSPR
jgi:hypothetical protein